MTTGSTSFGSQVPIGFADGRSGVVYNHYGSKTWSGADSSTTCYEMKSYVIPADYRSVRVRRGKEIVTIVRRSKIRKYRDYSNVVRPRDELHPYSMYYIVRDSAHGFSRTYSSWYGTWMPWQETAGGFSFQAPDPIWTPNDDISLLGKLREKVAGSSANFGVIAGTAHEALQTITSGANRLAKAIIFAKRGRFDLATRTLLDADRHLLKEVKSVANSWLELQYGWLPLLQDVHEAAEFLSNHYTLPRSTRVAVKRKVKGLVQTTSPGFCKPTSQEYFVSKRIVAYIEEADVQKLAGLEDPASVAWELLPYSFVADWFIPIGNYLQARGLSSSLKGRFVTSTFEKVDAKGFTPVAYAPSDNAYEFSGLEGDRLKIVQVNRSVSTSLSVPLPSIKPLSKSLTWMHAANAVALLTSNESRVRRALSNM